MLPDKQKLYQELTVIAGYIVNEIVCPACHIENCRADYWMADIEVWTMGDLDTNEEILIQIADKYELTEEQMVYIDSYTTIMQMALFIYLAQQ